MNSPHDKSDEGPKDSEGQPVQPEGEPRSLTASEAEGATRTPRTPRSIFEQGGGGIEREDTFSYGLGYGMGVGCRLGVGVLLGAILGWLVGWFFQDVIQVPSALKEENLIVLYIIYAVPVSLLLPVAKGILGKVLAIAAYVVALLISLGQVHLP